MPEVENLPLRTPMPTQERTATALEDQAAQLKKSADAQEKLAAALAAMPEVQQASYERHRYFWTALMNIVAAGQAPDIASALAAARELTDGFEVEFPDFTSPAQP